MVKEIVIYLEDLNFISIFLRVLMAVIFGGIIGYGREREKGLQVLEHIYLCLLEQHLQ